MNSPPLAIDLFSGLGGWSDGLIAEGWRVIGYDIEAHQYGDQKYPGELVIRDVLTIYGSEFKDADLIVASPPCQFFSYVAMPWSRGKALAAAVRNDPPRLEKELALFKACFRIQCEASEAAGRYIPMVVENVRGAQKWVGKARWNFGSYYLWGDVPALMPITQPRRKSKEGSWDQTRENYNPDKTWDGDATKMGPSPGKVWKDRPPNVAAHREQTGFKSQGMNWSDQTKKGQDFTRVAAQHCGIKQLSPARRAKHYDETAKMQTDGRKQPGISGKRTNGKGDKWFEDGAARSGSKSNARKAASAMIAKIPFPLAQWIAKTMKPI